MKRIACIALLNIMIAGTAVAQDNAAKASPVAAQDRPVTRSEAMNQREVKEDKVVARVPVEQADDAKSANNIFQQLGITDEQARQLQELEQAVSQKKTTISNNATLTDAQRKTKLVELNKRLDKGRQQILGEAVATKYTQLLAQQRRN